MCHKRQFAWFLLQNKIYGNPIMKFFVSLSVELRDQKFNNFFFVGFARKRSIWNFISLLLWLQCGGFVEQVLSRKWNWVRLSYVLKPTTTKEKWKLSIQLKYSNTFQGKRKTFQKQSYHKKSSENTQPLKWSSNTNKKSTDDFPTKNFFYSTFKHSKREISHFHPKKKNSKMYLTTS